MRPLESEYERRSLGSCPESDVLALLKRSIESLVIGGGYLCLAVFAAAQAPATFSARLTMMPIELATRADVTGSGSGSAVLDGRRLSVSGSFSGLRGPATIARLHEGRATGIRGTAFSELTVATAVKGTFSGEVELSREQVESLRLGRLYIQIHSETAPEGNLWGWLL